MAKKNKFNAIYSGIESYNDTTVFYNNKGEYSTIFKIVNPVELYCADVEAYYDFTDFISSIIKILGEGYALQKQDVLCRQKFSKKLTGDEPFLSAAYFKFFEGREYTEITTYLIITQERKSNKFFQYDNKKWKEFHQKVQKLSDFFSSRRISAKKLNETEIKEYVYRYFCVHFEKGAFSLDNFKSSDYSFKIGEKEVKCISLIDVDAVNLPSYVQPFQMENFKGNELPTDLMGFLSNVPHANCIIYNQVIIIPNQRAENNKLTKKKNRHASLSDPANNLAVEDISNVQEDIARNGKQLVYTHYNIIVTSTDSLDGAVNFIEYSLDKVGIMASKSAYNQLELFISSFPGNSYRTNPEYDRFLTLHDAASCLMYKERVTLDEDTPIKVYYTNRSGVPKAIDITGKEGKNKLTDNSNFFSLGGSGSGKSYHMNSVARQLAEGGTDLVIVDKGHSYEGTCAFFNGVYITYTDEKPITMNPFRITKEEDNIEKRDFLKNLILLIWKGVNGTVLQREERLISIIISEYYANYFANERDLSSRGIEDHLTKLRKDLVEKANEGELEHTYIEAYITQERKNLINAKDHKSKRIVTELSFNSFYEFACERIPEICKEKNINFDIDDFRFILEAFYKGGEFEKTLNNDMDISLFDEKFIVFEIDAISDHKVLFPIVTLIIMDIFIQKMRMKPNRKALIIEEAWKALASDLMANYIKYLYKTCRKFWGIVGVVTQEIDDLLDNPIIKKAIIGNSSVKILLDQSSFKNKFQEIADLLGLTQTECIKIWTVNNLDNQDGRSYFREVFIKRGSYSDVYGVEEPKECYITYTTERSEKDALKKYIKKYGSIETAIVHFCNDWNKSGHLRAMEFVNSKYFLPA